MVGVLDDSINVAMEPFRAFVGDQLAPPQRPLGYAMQSFFIGLGAVVASALPWIWAQFGFRNSGTAGAGQAIIPDTVRHAFDLGAVVLVLAMLWTVLRTREYPPDELQSFSDAIPPPAAFPATSHAAGWRRGMLWSGCGLIGVGAILEFELDWQMVFDCDGAFVGGPVLLMHGY